MMNILLIALYGTGLSLCILCVRLVILGYGNMRYTEGRFDEYIEWQEFTNRLIEILKGSKGDTKSKTVVAEKDS